MQYEFSLVKRLRHWWFIEHHQAYQSSPLSHYDDAVERVQQWWINEQQEDLHDECGTRLLTHGRKVSNVIVIFHGFTSCPHQFDLLADQFYQQGDNVLITRLPFHGLKDRKTLTTAQMTLETLTTLGDQAIDIAGGLGENIKVCGISTGGLIAAWVAQNRADVDKVLILSGAFGIYKIPKKLHGFYARMIPLLKNKFQYWNPRLKEQTRLPKHIYLGYSTHSINTLLRLGIIVKKAAQYSKPSARSIIVAINPIDNVVRNEDSELIIRHWQEHGGNVQKYEFPVDSNLPHDLIEPEHKYQQIAQVYPIILELLNQGP